MADVIANSIASANSFSELDRALSGDRRLTEPMSTLALRLPLEEAVVAAILLLTGPDLPLGRFLQHKEIHRALTQRAPYDQLLRAFKRAILETHDLVAAIEEAKEFAQLIRFLSDEMGRRKFLDVLHRLPISAHFKHRFLNAPRHLTILEFMRLADHQDWSDRDFSQILSAFKQWLAQQLGQPERAASNVVTLPQVTPESLAELVKATRIPDLGEWSFAMLEGDQKSDMFAKVSWALRHGNRLDLKQRLDRFTARLAHLRSLPAPVFERPADEGLALIQAAAQSERASLADAYPWGIISGSAHLLLKAPHLGFEVRPQGSLLMPSQVTAPAFWSWAQTPTLDCDCRAPMCVHRIIVLEGLCGPWVHEPAPSAFLKDALRPSWDRVLDAIAPPKAVQKKKRGVLSFQLSARLVEFTFHELGKKGPSSKGKRVTPGSALPLVDGLDHRIAERFALAELSDDDDESAHFGDGLLMLEGHPRVRWYGEPEPSPVVRAEGTVKVEETPTGFRLEFLVGGVTFDDHSRIYACSEGAVVLLRSDDHRILVTHVSESYLRLLEVTKRFGALLPKEAAPRLVELLPTLEAGSLVELPDDLRGEEREPADRPLVRVASANPGLKLSIRVEPLEQGAVFVPGQGVPVSASFDGRKRRFTRRRFERELAEANALAGALGLDPSLAPEPYTWVLDGSDRHVETLRRLSTSGVPVEWLAPKVKFTGEATLDRLRLEITRKKDWFGLDGEVTVDERRVSLAALLEAARERRRFVKLGEGDFAQLSETMVEALAPLSHLSQGDALPQLTPGTAPLLEALAPQLEALDAAKEWSALMERLAESRTARFPVPKTLKATLRDYQVEGFEWMSRLAQWGVGACLADDMGLGKTVQALALLLSRAKRGPALVVAPSSVLHTWREEASRFAPSLRLALFHEGDRALGELGPMDVVVVSWSLLAREAAAFSDVRFTTVILDEAHAIKNADTLRAKAAHRLQADFLVALSGTPIENHVGELWSLFKAVMPTLLGSEESFRRRFGAGQREALAALSTLIRPFVLRRTKGAVAKELPPRTDLEVIVPLSAEERALYDDVRLSAVADLGELTGESKRFDVLAALTRLRLTACHPKLVDAAWAGPTSKLSRLLELVESLSAAGHRVLVFSQFTQHLALVVEALRSQGVVFSYLDGQVPLAERHRRVEAFQQGSGGDVFLVSLKAGGTGLTLTAADYVIHLDPWWNPAVEDQASDRTHRIGQTRPVTVYRLIAEGTIEQQILSLHRDKRELVDALLSGADTVGKLSTTQLAELIRTSG